MGRQYIPVPHQHVFSVLNSCVAEERHLVGQRRLRILDIGCGDGRMIHALHSLAGAHLRGTTLEVHGFDIGEYGFKNNEQRSGIVDFLSSHHPDVEWSKRIRVFAGDEDWDYPSGYFDIAVSNQVIEHVDDLPSFFSNLNRVLKSNGFSIHLFPSAHCVQEAHVRVPLAHWIKDFHYRVGWIALMSRLGVGKYRHDRRILGHEDVNDHAVKSATYIECWTNYRTFKEIAGEASRHRMATSYHFTKDFFFTKLRTVLGLPQKLRYRRWTAAGLEWLTFMLGRHLSSITLVIRPLNYDIGKRIAAEKAEKAKVEEDGDVELLPA